jgi:hypothetical protein
MKATVFLEVLIEKIYGFFKCRDFKKSVKSIAKSFDIFCSLVRQRIVDGLAVETKV